MNRRTALTAVALSAIALFNVGCKTLSARKKDEEDHDHHSSDEGMFSKVRDNDGGNGTMGLSSKSREIERNLGVGE